MPPQRRRDTESRENGDKDEPSFSKPIIHSPVPHTYVFSAVDTLDANCLASSSSAEPISPSDSGTTPTPSNLINTTNELSYSHSHPSTSSSSYYEFLSSPHEPPNTTTPVFLKRRKSCPADTTHLPPISSGGERRPRKGDEDYVKRPENAFILFRRKCCEDDAAALSKDPTKKKLRQADLSRAISQQWKSLGQEERARWEKLAKEKKKEHELLYPNYVYRPTRGKDKEREREGSVYRRRNHKEVLRPGEKILSFVVQAGRSQSMPNSGHNHRPPAASYLNVEIPDVYSPPSCPSSPSLLPLLARQSSTSQSHEEIMKNFDFIPCNPGAVGDSPQSYTRPPFPGQPHSYPQSHSRSHSTSSTLSSPLLGEPFTPRDEPLSPASLPGILLSQPSFGLTTPTNDPIEMDLQRKIQLQQQQDYEHLQKAYSWGDANGIWGGNNEFEYDAGDQVLFDGNDFDLNSIPPLELGASFNMAPNFGMGVGMGIETGVGMDGNFAYNSSGLPLSPQDVQQYFNFDIPGGDHGNSFGGEEYTWQFP